jgi:hypothetical protein
MERFQPRGHIAVVHQQIAVRLWHFASGHNLARRKRAASILAKVSQWLQ